MSMTATDATAFVREHGIVLASAKGPVPRLGEAIVDEPIKGSWWAHSKSRQIFAILQAVAESSDILVCRLVEGRVTFVHRRLWPALVRVAERFPANQLAQVRKEHTPSGKHVSRAVPFPNWVPAEVRKEAERIREREALIALGPWTLVPNPQLERARRKPGDP